MEKKKLAELLVEEKESYHGSITIHFAHGKAKKIEYKFAEQLEEVTVS